MTGPSLGFVYSVRSSLFLSPKTPYVYEVIKIIEDIHASFVYLCLQ